MNTSPYSLVLFIYEPPRYAILIHCTRWLARFHSNFTNISVNVITPRLKSSIYYNNDPCIQKHAVKPFRTTGPRKWPLNDKERYALG